MLQIVYFFLFFDIEVFFYCYKQSLLLFVVFKLLSGMYNKSVQKIRTGGSMAYKLIAIDIDDTLITHDRTIPDRVAKSIQKARDKGVHVVLCTGRTRKGAQRYYDEIALDTLFITAGGAEVFDAQGKRQYAQPVDPALTKELLKYAHDNCLHAQVFIDGELVYKEQNKYSDLYEESYGHPGIVMNDIMDQESITTPKVLFVIEKDIMCDIKQQTMDLFPTLTIKQSKPNFLEFAHPDVDKGKALKFVADFYQVDREDIIAIGDNDIDIPMIEYAGLGVVVENASNTVKKSADVICASSDDGGVADVIEKYILEASYENKTED